MKCMKVMFHMWPCCGLNSEKAIDKLLFVIFHIIHIHTDLQFMFYHILKWAVGYMLTETVIV